MTIDEEAISVSAAGVGAIDDDEDGEEAQARVPSVPAESGKESGKGTEVNWLSSANSSGRPQLSSKVVAN